MSPAMTAAPRGPAAGVSTTLRGAALGTNTTLPSSKAVVFKSLSEEPDLAQLPGRRVGAPHHPEQQPESREAPSRGGPDDTAAASSATRIGPWATPRHPTAGSVVLRRSCRRSVVRHRSARRSGRSPEVHAPGVGLTYSKRVPLVKITVLGGPETDEPCGSERRDGQGAARHHCVLHGDGVRRGSDTRMSPMHTKRSAMNLMN